jgi:RNA 3'-terminal phosphate cyclase (ATP)
MPHPPIELDGSLGEGGGQIVRTSLALSLVTGKPFHLRNIRAGRAKPGLQPQHLMCVRAAAGIGQASVVGASKGSGDIHFEPGAVSGGAYHFAIGTAGATGLVLHTIYLPLARAGAPSDVTVDGGTHVSHSPCFHFLETTWRGYLEMIGLNVSVKMRRPGFYPRGGGLLQAHVEPCAGLNGLHLDHLEPPTRITGFSAVAGLPEQIARRQANRAEKRLRDRGLKTNLGLESWAGGPGTVLALVLHTAPVPTLIFALGERGKPAERVADDAVDQALRFLDADPLGVDAHSADQLVLPLALAHGPSSFPVAEITSHLVTNVAVIRSFVDRDIQWEGKEGGPGFIRIG